MKTINKLTGFIFFVLLSSCFNPMLCAQENDRTGHDLPFEETWAHGSFTFYQWTPSENWAIDTEEGNPAPTAVFSGTPQLSDYSCPLTSYTLNTAVFEYHDIILSFDVKLDNIFPTGTEYLQVYVVSGEQSFFIKSFQNDSSFAWANFAIDISHISRDENIKVEFRVEGANSNKFDNWMIDNILVENSCPTAHELEGDYMAFQYIELTWAAADSAHYEWLDYNDNSFEHTFNIDSSDRAIAQLFTPTSYPSFIKKLRYWNANTEYHAELMNVYVIDDDGETILSGPHPVTDGPAGDWVEIDIPIVPIYEGKFYVATFVSTENGPSIGLDDSFYNGTVYFGTFGNWTELSELGMYYFIGSHEVMVETEFEYKGLLPTINSNSAHSSSDQSSLNSFDAGKKSQPNYLGCDVYRRYADQDEFYKINDEMLTVSYFTDQNYHYGYNYYYIQSFFEDCQSNSDTSRIYVIIGDINKSANRDFLFIYPNPVESVLYINSRVAIKQLLFQAHNGQTIATINGNNQKEIKINTEGYKPGIYFVIIETEAGTFSRKLSIVH